MKIVRAKRKIMARNAKNRIIATSIESKGKPFRKTCS